MTYVYDWFGFPNEFSVICPKCRKESVGKDIPKELNCSAGKSSFSFTENVENGTFECNISCINCGYKGIKNLSWPEDAFWKFDVKGKILWAWSKEHSQEILEYLNSSKRDEFQYKNTAALLHIPKHFKLAKNRSLAVKKIRNELQKNT